VIKKQS